MVMDARQGKFYLYGYTDKKRCAALPGRLWHDIRRPVGTQNEFLAGGIAHNFKAVAAAKKVL
ncbi:hypothetical protein [Pseudomonas sp. S3_H06]